MKLNITFSLIIVFLMIIVQTFGYADSLLLPVQEPSNRGLLGLKITGLEEYSSLGMAGAQKGDILTHYNGVKLESVSQLLALRDRLEQDEVEVILRRGLDDIKFSVPKGVLGVYLKEIAAEHQIDNDAVIVDGIGHLDWGIGMENSFLGCVTLLEEKYGSKMSYQGILGLSGYGFRFHFFKGFCPSSPDATCGRDIGAEVLNKLGYEFEVYSLPDTGKTSKDEIEKAKEELQKKIKLSIDHGWPVIAIDLIDVAEWGIITGYQKNGKELFCRTYFDMTEGYEIAQKFPWVIYAIKGKKEIDIKDEYKKSLILAKDLYSKKDYGSYTNGINGIKTWIKALKDNKFFKSMDEKKLYETMHANWWIYYSLADARTINGKYLTANKEKFGVDTKVIEKLTQLMEDESSLLNGGINSVPSIWERKDASVWTSEVRAQQVEILDEFLKLEEQVNQILKTKIK